MVVLEILSLFYVIKYAINAPQAQYVPSSRSDLELTVQIDTVKTTC